MGAALTYLPLAPWAGEAVVFTGSVTSGTLPIAYAWAFGDGATGVGSVVSHTYAVSGVHTVVMTATNCGDGASSVVTRAITVTDCPVQTDFTYEPAVPRTGELVTFTGVVSGGTAGLPVTTTWDFGDSSPPLVVGVTGVVSRSAVVTHTFPLVPAARTYTVTMGVPAVCSGSLRVQKAVTVQPYSLYLPAIMRKEL
jgi:PKD repeat protein